MKTRQSRYYGSYYERQNAWRRDNYASNPTYKSRIISAKNRRYTAHKVRLNAIRRDRYITDSDYRASTLAHNRRLEKHQPEWVDTLALRKIYRDCPEGHEVDHIIPLKGRIDKRRVSGLHVPWNLQYLTISDNRAKHCWISESDIPKS